MGPQHQARNMYTSVRWMSMRRRGRTSKQGAAGMACKNVRQQVTSEQLSCMCCSHTDSIHIHHSLSPHERGRRPSFFFIPEIGFHRHIPRSLEKSSTGGHIIHQCPMGAHAHSPESHFPSFFFSPSSTSSSH